MENNKMYCPLIKEFCNDKKCAWYVIGINACAMNVLAQAMDDQSNTIQEMKNND